MEEEEERTGGESREGGGRGKGAEEIKGYERRKIRREKMKKAE
jgi:hypothetical protein